LENCLIISNGALACSIYVASGSVVKHSLSSFKAFTNYGGSSTIVENRGRHEAEVCNEDIRYMRFPKGPNS
ncbi:hypothetical protein T4E_7642, partial [Trichinella pseudospiralis]